MMFIPDYFFVLCPKCERENEMKKDNSEGVKKLKYNIWNGDRIGTEDIKEWVRN